MVLPLPASKPISHAAEKRVTHLELYSDSKLGVTPNI